MSAGRWLPAVIFTAAIGATPFSTVIPQWEWVEDRSVLNPSGICVDIPDGVAFVDADEDGDCDLVLMEGWRAGQCRLLYCENCGNASHAEWKANDRLFEQVNEYPISGGVTFCDLDGDGCKDMVTRIDSNGYSGLWYWRNAGTLLQPDWQGSALFFAGIETDLTYPTFADVDGDGDLDAALTRLDSWRSNGIRYYENIGDAGHPLWQEDLTLFAVIEEDAPGYFWERPALADYDGDGDYDLIFAVQVEDLRWIASYENSGTAQSPRFMHNDAFPRIGGLVAHPHCYAFSDIDADGDLDLCVGTSRELRLYENFGDSANLDIGSVYTEMNKLYGQRPSLYDCNGDGLLDPIVASNHNSWSTGGRWISYFTSYVQTYENGSRKWTQNGWFGRFHGPAWPWPADVHPVLFDMDDDGMADAVFGGVYSSPTRSRIFHFEESDTTGGFSWEENEGFFARFNDSDTVFTIPVPIDIDNDSDFDLLVKRDSLFTFYENGGRVSHPLWVPNEHWLAGTDELDHYTAAFADIDLDGDFDLVFGESNGILTCYENVGDRFSPLWQKNAAIFAGIGFGPNCAPAFGDMDRDGDVDLVVGNEEGRVFYFENRSFEGCVQGDIDCDGALDVADVILCVNIVIRLYEPNGYEWILSDFNRDMHTDVLDIVSMVRAILGR